METMVCPRVLSVMRSMRDPAVDASLLDSLPTLTRSLQGQILQMLFERGDLAAFGGLVARFHTFDDWLREQLVDRVRRLSDSLRAAVDSSDLQTRINTIVIIAVSDDDENLSLLVDGLRSSCRQTRTIAAKSLVHVTRKRLRTRSSDPLPDETAALPTRNLEETFCLAIRRGAHDEFPELLELGLRVGGRVETVAFELAKEKGTSVAECFCRIVEATSDPQLAGTALRSLAHPQLATRVGHAIVSNSNASFLSGLLNSTALSLDDGVISGCRHLNDRRWIRDLLQALTRIDDSRMAQAVRLVLACARSAPIKEEVLCELLGSDRTATRQATLSKLAGDSSSIVTHWLGLIAVRHADELGNTALRQWRLRRLRSGLSSNLQYDETDAENRHFERCWRALASGNSPSTTEQSPEDRSALGKALLKKLKSNDPVDRARALRLGAAWDLVDSFAADLPAFAQDVDPMVRSYAVRLLATSKSAIARHVLNGRLHDSDPRVQANCIEALDQVAAPNRVERIRTNLSAKHPRVRANTVRSLLHSGEPSAGDALLAMFNDSAPQQRISGLWVVQSLRLRSCASRVAELAEHDPDPMVRTRAEQTCRILAERSVPASVFPGITARPFALEPLSDSAGEPMRTIEASPR